MAYTERDFRSKKELKEAVARGEQVRTYQPGGIFPSQQNGTVYLEGPHFPKPHSWYAQAVLKDGIVIKVK